MNKLYRLDSPRFNSRFIRESIIFSCALVLFLILTWVVMTTHFLESFDFTIQQLVQSHSSLPFIHISYILDFLFQEISVVCITFFLAGYFFIRHSRRDGIFLMSTLAVTSFLVWILKQFVQRSRPIGYLFFKSSYAFPSGHSTLACVFFGLLIFLSLRYSRTSLSKIVIAWSAVIAILAVGISRLVLQIHWASDVLGGFLLGLVCLTGALAVLRLVEDSEEHTLFG